MIELRVSEPDPIILEAEEQDQASLAVLEAFVSGGDIPAYTGSYNVTPTQSQQTLETNGKKMVRDVKVAPIPSQYIIPEGTLEVTQNGQQSVREYENVNVNVPAPTGEKTINVSQNGTTTEDVANYATAKVVTNVPASAVDTGTKNINANGTHNVVGYASANVNVPNSYSASDEGKVVSNGALVAQTSDTVTQNGVVDTTLINSLTVNVSGGGGEDLNKMIQGTLTTITNSDVTSIAKGAFQYSALQSASFPNVETIGTSAFGSCASLSSVSFPKAKNIIAGNVFEGTAIQILVLPAITSESGSYAFRNNAAMTHLDLGSGFRGFSAQACAGNTNMATIILRKSSGIVTLGQTAVFNNTPFKSGGTGGTIYIPKVLYDHLGDNSSLDYKAATNWTTVNGYGTITWAKIEGSIYETQYADGTQIPTT
jgi:hypothetical protein